MHKFLFILSFVWCGLYAQQIPEPPKPPRLVNDFVGGLLSPQQIQALEQKLVAFNDSSSTQITVVIVKSVQPGDIFSYAQELSRKWGIGQEGKNNGILLLWAPGDRKVRIHVGYGLEGSMTDAMSKRIISQIISPYFKELKYYEGLNSATDAIIKVTKGEFEAEPQLEEFPLLDVLILFFIVMFVLWLLSRGNRNNRNDGGMRRHHSGWPFWTYTGGGFNSGSWGGSGSSWGSGGDSWGGGGFGGFGGGSFGGGGASGDY